MRGLGLSLLGLASKILLVKGETVWSHVVSKTALLDSLIKSLAVAVVKVDPMHDEPPLRYWWNHSRPSGPSDD